MLINTQCTVLFMAGSSQTSVIANCSACVLIAEGNKKINTKN